jgi:hypothetical protein
VWDLKPFLPSDSDKSWGKDSPTICRSYGAGRNLDIDIYKDSAPPERDLSPRKFLSSKCKLPAWPTDWATLPRYFWSDLKFTSFALAAVLGFSCLSANGVNGDPGKPPLVVTTPLDIRVQANAFGKASAADITLVLSSAAAQLIRYCPHIQLDGIDVYYRPDHPEIDLHRTRDKRIAMVLSARDTHWAQYSFQFAHEFCHALANFSDHSSSALANVPNRNLWLEESLCETASLFVLRAMSRSWATNPPQPAWQAYAPWLSDYVDRRMALPENRLRIGISFSVWFHEHQTALQKDAGQRTWNTIVATQLLPIFEADPAGWEAVTFLNRRPSGPNESLSQHFAEWRASCPNRLHSFVAKLAGVFGVALR